MPYKTKELEREYKRRWYLKNRVARAAYVKAYRSKNLEKIRVYHREYGRRLRTGWSPERFAEFMAIQEGKCAICAKPFDASRSEPCADHDHATDRPRGLLCRRCNRGMGLLNDDVAPALNYIAKWRT